MVPQRRHRLFVFDVVLNATVLEGSKLGIGMEWVGLTMLFGDLGVRGSPG